MIISKVLLWDRENPTVRSKSSVSCKLSSSAMAKASTVGLLGLYFGSLLIFQNVFLLTLARL